MNFDWDAIIDIANDMLIVSPIQQDNFITTIQNGRGNVCLALHNKKLFAVKFITNSFTCS